MTGLSSLSKVGAVIGRGHSGYISDHARVRAGERPNDSYRCAAVAIRLEEGPVMIPNLTGPEPEGRRIRRAATLCYEDGGTGRVIPRVRLSEVTPPP